MTSIAGTSLLTGLLLALVICALLYGLLIVAVALGGRREEAQALARLVPDMVGLLRRLLADPRVSTAHKLLLGAAVAYLALPFDLVPDFVPVIGALDDAIVVGLVLRLVLRAAG